MSAAVPEPVAPVAAPAPEAVPEPVAVPAAAARPAPTADWDVDDGTEPEPEPTPEVATVATPEPAPAPAAKPETPATPALHPYLLRQAQRAGFEPADLEGMTEAAVERLVEAATRRQPAAPEPKPEPTPEPDVDLGLDAEVYSEPLVKVLKDQAKTIKRLEAEAAAAKAERQQQTAKQVFDAEFAKHKAVLGDDAEVAAARRHAVLAHLATIPPDRRTTLQADVAKAVRLLYGAAATEAASGGTDAPPPVATAATPAKKPVPARDPKTGEFLSAAEAAFAAKWDASGAAKPTARANPAEPPGVKRAEKAVEEWKLNAGLTDSPTAEDADERTLE